MRVSAIAIIIAVLTMGGLVQPGFAMPQFKKAFDEKYTNKSDNDEFKAAAKKEGCNICHIKGEKKNVQNDYGKELAKLIEGDAEHRLKDADAEGKKDEELEKILKELDAAFPKVEEMKNKAGETFGARMKEHKLPSDPALQEKSEGGEKEEK